MMKFVIYKIPIYIYIYFYVAMLKKKIKTSHTAYLV